MKKFFVMIMLLVTMVFASVANAAPSKVELADNSIMAALQNDIQPEGRTKESFVIQGMNDIDTRVLIINMQTSQVDLYRLTSTSDFKELLEKEINCKDSRKPGSLIAVLQDKNMAELFAQEAGNITQISSSKNKGPVYKLSLKNNRVPNANLDAFLMEKGFDDNAVFINVQTGKLVIRPLERILDYSSKVNDLFSLPSTLKNSWNVITNKSGW